MAVAEICSGRVLAFLVLQRAAFSGRFLQDVFAAADAEHHLSAADRALAVEIASGVIRRFLTIDHILQVLVTRPRAWLEPDLWRVLQIGCFQLLFGSTPRHAAVHATVELCRDLQRERWTGFVNGVLRSVDRLVLGDAAAGLAADVLPVSGHRWKQLAQSVMPDPVSDPTGALSVSFSLPAGLVARWRQQLRPERLLAACFHCNEAPGVTLRVNRMRSSASSLTKSLPSAGCGVTPGIWQESLRVTHAGRVDQLPGFREGWWSVQDESAMAAGFLMAPRPGERLLDLCAAPGGKTTHLAELSDDAAEILACDVTESRLTRIQENAERLQLRSIRTLLIQRDGSGLPSELFDGVLADVPCSNTGVLARRPEARWRFSAEELPELADLQLKILEIAAGHVRVGGRLVYSTCSIEPEENREVVERFLVRHSHFELRREQWHDPGSPADGGWQALLVRRGD